MTTTFMDSQSEMAAFNSLREELDSACAHHPRFNSAHEGYAVILEELDELKEQVWKKDKERDVEAMRKEATQVAAMAIRFVIECT